MITHASLVIRVVMFLEEQRKQTLLKYIQLQTVSIYLIDFITYLSLSTLIFYVMVIIYDMATMTCTYFWTALGVFSHV